MKFDRFYNVSSFFKCWFYIVFYAYQLKYSSWKKCFFALEIFTFEIIGQPIGNATKNITLSNYLSFLRQNFFIALIPGERKKSIFTNKTRAWLRTLHFVARKYLYRVFKILKNISTGCSKFMWTYFTALTTSVWDCLLLKF